MKNNEEKTCYLCGESSGFLKQSEYDENKYFHDDCLKEEAEELKRKRRFEGD